MAAAQGRGLGRGTSVVLEVVKPRSHPFPVLSCMRTCTCRATDGGWAAAADGTTPEERLGVGDARGGRRRCNGSEARVGGIGRSGGVPPDMVAPHVGALKK